MMNGTAAGTAISHTTHISGRAPPNIPTFVCEYTTLGTLRFFCPFCKHMHLHGGGSGGKEPPILGHRGAHCSRMDSPYHRTGYFLALKE
jgi:hypothetical protein